MRSRTLLISCCALVAFAGCRGDDPVPAPPANASASPVAETPASPFHGTTAGVAWIEIVTGGARPSDRLPMIVGAHGLGGSPAEFIGVFANFHARARVILLRGILPFHDGFAWFVTTDRDLDGEETAKGLAAAGDQVALAIPAIARERPTLGLPIMTGFSQGGALSYEIAAHHPETIAAAYPLSGWLPPALRTPIATTSTRPPILAFHGAADPVVPIAEGRATIARLVAAGYRAELREIPGMVHTVGPAERVELYQHLETNVTAAGP